MQKILVFCAPWHIGKSASAKDIFIDPLKPHLDIEVRAWDDQKELPSPNLDSDVTSVVFWQVEPPQNWLQALPGHIVWVPMWDAVGGFPLAWWQKFPKDLRVVAFSKNIASRTEAVGLPTLNCQYFADPSACSETRWEGERVAFYWNRRGLVGVEFLHKFCAAAKVDRLLYRDDVDPFDGADACRCKLPERLGQTVIELIPWMESRADYNEQLNRAQIFIAPRDCEGVGIAFLEVMARGCAVVAYDAPTMNEYVESGKNGVLLSSFGGQPLNILFVRLKRKLQKKISALFGKSTPLWPRISEIQDWAKLSRIDYPAIGRLARKEHVAGFARWQGSVENLAKFVAQD